MLAPDPVSAPSRDALVAAAAADLARRVAAVPIPEPALEGWQSLCAGEYAAAAHALAGRVALAVEALRSAAALP